MSMKKWTFVALVALAALGACSKKSNESQQQQATAQPPAPGTSATEGQPTPPGQEQPRSEEQAGQPSAPGTEPATATPSTPAPPSPESAAVLAALDDKAGSLTEGLGQAFMGGLARKRVVGSEPSPGGLPTVAAEPEPSPIQRVQMLLDFASFRSSALWPMVQGLLQAAAAQEGDDATCVIGLLDKISTLYADIALGPGGEPSNLLVSLKSTATNEEFMGCIRGTADEGVTFEDVRIGGRPAYVIRNAEAGQGEPTMAMLEASPGNWLIGFQAALEGAGTTDPEADPAFQALAAPLGAGTLKVAIIPVPGALAGAAGELPPAVQCLGAAMQQIKGASIGVRIAPDLGLTVAVQNESAAAAAESQACFSALWTIAKPALLAEIDPEDARGIESMIGMPLAQVLDAVRIEAQGNFVKLSASFEGEILTRLTELLARFAS